MRWNNKFESRLSGLCSADLSDSGDSGSDGGGGGAEAVVDSAPPSIERNGGGGARDVDADHRFSGNRGYDSPEDAVNVTKILAKGDDAKLSFGELDLLLGFQGVSPKAQPKEKVVQGKPGAPASEASPAAVQSPSSAPGQPPAPPAIDPSVKVLTTKIDELLTAGTRAADGATPGAAPKPQRFYGDVSPAVTVPENLMRDLMDPDDPAKNMNAINTLVNGIMNRVMEDQMKVMSRAIQRLQEHIPQAVNTVTSGRQITDKFYSKFAELNKPGIQPLVNHVAKQLMAQRGNNFQADDAFLNELGTSVHAAFKAQFGFDLPRAAAPAAAPSNGTPAVGKRKTFVTPGGARPPAAPGNRQSADLLDFIM